MQVMLIYDKILKNEKYLDLVNKIENIKFITDGQWDWEHGFGHFKRVAKFVKIILKQLNVDNRIIDLGMTSALLHDIGLIKGIKTDHAYESAHMLNEFFTDTDISQSEVEIIKQAINDHSKGINMKTIVGAALFLADKLDITYHRVEHSSIQDYRNKVIQNIKSVDIEIDSQNLVIRYSVVNNFNKKILCDIFKNWDKPITAPLKVAKYLNKKCIFIINEKEIDLSEYSV